MRDGLGREVDYLRLSLTDRCSLRCIYCMPEEGIPLADRGEILSLEELFRLTWLMVEHAGIRKVRITGGEPLERKGVVRITSWLSSLDLRDLAMTTNGLVIGDIADELARAGLRRVNVSLDSLRDDRLRMITRRDVTLSMIESGIRAALDAGLGPVKVNCVVLAGVNDDELPDFLEWGSEMGVQIRFIEHMPASLGNEVLVTAVDMLDRLSGKGAPAPVESDQLSTDRLYRVGENGPLFGVIAPFSHDMCSDCRRLRLTAGGELVTCLAGSRSTDLGRLVAEGADEKRLVHEIRSAIAAKPARRGECGRVEMWRTGG